MADDVIKLIQSISDLATIVSGLQDSVMALALRVKELEENESKKLQGV